jgi:hypothetical protein
MTQHLDLDGLPVDLELPQTAGEGLLLAGRRRDERLWMLMGCA